MGYHGCNKLGLSTVNYSTDRSITFCLKLHVFEHTKCLIRFLSGILTLFFSPTV